MGCGNELAWLAAVLRVHRYGIDSYDLERLRRAVEQHLEIQNRVRGTIANSPKLRLAALHFENRRSESGHAGVEVGGSVSGNIIHRQVMVGNLDIAVHLRARLWQLLERRLIANHQNPLLQSRNGR